MKITKDLITTTAALLIIAAATAGALLAGLPNSAIAAPSPSTIDAQQLCQRTQHVRIAILPAVPNAAATCVDADPPVAASYETNVTSRQLAEITTLDLMARYPEIPLIGEFREGDFQGLTGLTEIHLVEQPLPSVVQQTVPHGPDHDLLLRPDPQLDLYVVDGVPDRNRLDPPGLGNRSV